MYRNRPDLLATGYNFSIVMCLFRFFFLASCEKFASFEVWPRRLRLQEQLCVAFGFGTAISSSRPLFDTVMPAIHLDLNFNFKVERFAVMMKCQHGICDNPQPDLSAHFRPTAKRSWRYWVCRGYLSLLELSGNLWRCKISSVNCTRHPISPKISHPCALN